MRSDLTQVRAEDQFDVEKMHAWLKNMIPDLGQVPDVLQFRKGASNLTYLLQYEGRELVLRKPPAGTKAASAHDMSREVLIQRALKPNFGFVPTIFAFCDDPSIMGSHFYVMERINGQILRVPQEINISKGQATSLAESMVDGFLQLHQVDPTVLDSLNKGPGYVQRQVEGWGKRYTAALTDDVPAAVDLIQWLHTHQPVDVASRVIHGDWRLDNMVFDMQGPSLIGVLDWELATVGDPLMDLGSSLAYWVESNDEHGFANLRRQPSDIDGMPTRNQIIEKYLEKSSYKCDDFTFYEIFGLFRLSVIIQQIWYRYRLGQTSNPSFAEFGVAVNVLINRARGLMK